MDYVAVAEAQASPGLRLALTAGVPAPWSMAARFFFDVKGIHYMPVLQVAGQANDDLVAWTGHRNAPVAVLDDEAPRTNWADILELAERLNPEPALVPKDSESRLRMFGLANEVCGANGLVWNTRHLMMAPVLQSKDENLLAIGRTMGKAYGFSEDVLATAPTRAEQILDLLSRQLQTQAEAGSRYFIGEGLTALDLIWASFSNTLRPLPQAHNPMDAGMRKVYSSMGERFTPDELLFQHRDYVYERYLTLPLDF